VTAGRHAVSDDQQSAGAPGAGEPAGIDTSRAHIARVYDYWLGGKDNFAVDREAARQAIEANPEIVHTARANRAFLGRAVRFLAGEAGVRQFLDIGTGLPSANNTHEVAQSAAPESRIVYVDNDPMVLVHARALLASRPEGATAYIDADLRDAGRIVAGARRLLDFSQPVAVMLVAILHFIPDSADPYRIVAGLVDAVAPGSYLVISHPASDIDSGVTVGMAERLNKLMAQKGTMRDHAGVSRFFDGLDLVSPGIVRVPAWRPASQFEFEAASPASLWAGVAKKP
jgi:S-adenosyl methyltransferase